MAAPARDAWDRVAHPSYPEVWERILPETRDPYEITERFAEEFARRPDYIKAYRAWKRTPLASPNNSFALDNKLALGPDASRADIMAAMQGHILGKAVYEARFHR